MKYVVYYADKFGRTYRVQEVSIDVFAGILACVRRNLILHISARLLVFEQEGRNVTLEICEE